MPFSVRQVLAWVAFDAGFGASYLARVVGQKKAREIWFLCRKYNAQEALDMGLVNKVVPFWNSWKMNTCNGRKK